jgi:hypothetical protein
MKVNEEMAVQLHVPLPTALVGDRSASRSGPISPVESAAGTSGWEDELN